MPSKRYHGQCPTNKERQPTSLESSACSIMCQPEYGAAARAGLAGGGIGAAAAGDWLACGEAEDEGVLPGRSTVRVGLPVTAWKLSITTLACTATSVVVHDVLASGTSKRVGAPTVVFSEGQLTRSGCSRMAVDRVSQQ